MDRTVERLDVNIPEHAGFVYDLGLVCKDDLLDDYSNDIILVIADSQCRIANGTTQAFLCRVDGQMAGIVWVDLDPKGIGYIHAGLMPEFRKGFTALHFLRLFIGFCFETLSLRKLEMYLPPRNYRAEKLVRRLGFKKEGFRKEATLIDGKPQHHVVLALTKNKYEGKQDGQR